MDRAFKMEKIEGVKIDLPDSITSPSPRFKNTNEAIQFYVGQLEQIANKKRLSLDELRRAASKCTFGTDESFFILNLFDSLKALKALTK